MAGLEQRKLTKSEWEGIEAPVSNSEKKILSLIINGFKNTSILTNPNLSLIQTFKVEKTDPMENHLYVKYFKDTIDKLCSTYDIDFKAKNFAKDKVTIKKVDQLRISHMDENIGSIKKEIYEFVLLGLAESMLKNIAKKEDKWVQYYYTMKTLCSYHIINANAHLIRFVTSILRKNSKKVSLKKFIKHINKYVETNTTIGKYEDLQLYSHQKMLFNFCKNNPVPKLILYIAPTGTGKTLSPLGLSEKYKVIFVCAARHVGLALAKSAISMEKKVAFAFGCKDPGDIRLHYAAAKDYQRHRKSGGIFRVDNSVGDNVEIMITDIASYIPAMHYMKAFNSPHRMLLYWDEPTITLDYEEHSFHEIIKKNWSENIIPNVVLSSATLPKEHEIKPTIDNFRTRFGGVVHTVTSHDCKKSIPILNKDGYVELPHFMFDDYADVKRCVEHCKSYQTILRYFDLRETASFISFVNLNKLVDDKYLLDKTFKGVEEITQSSMKLHYLDLLTRVKESDWPEIVKFFREGREGKPRIPSSVYLTTKDSHTMTDGPTIYMAEDIEKIAKFCVQIAKIPELEMKNLLSAIDFNNQLLDEIRTLEKDVEDALTKSGDMDKEKKMSDMRVAPEIKEMMKEIEKKKKIIKVVSLNNVYIPNSLEHLDKWCPGNKNRNCYRCDISEQTVEKIMLIDDIEDIWKILLLMGIGVFTTYKSIAYIEVMKELAEQQKLFMIIASTDYIYGTNYQFSHGFVGKDLDGMTQEKAIQAMGRIGRNNINQNFTIRFRNNDLIKRLFVDEEDKIEVKNMCRLFC